MSEKVDPARALLQRVIDSDMAMREEDDDRGPDPLLNEIRALLATPATTAPSEPVAQAWLVDEQAVACLRRFTEPTDGDEPPAIVLSVGEVIEDDERKHGLRAHLDDYPDEGCILLSESPAPPPPRADDAEPTDEQIADAIECEFSETHEWPEGDVAIVRAFLKHYARIAARRAQEQAEPPSACTWPACSCLPTDRCEEKKA